MYISLAIPIPQYGRLLESIDQNVNIFHFVCVSVLWIFFDIFTILGAPKHFGRKVEVF